MLRAYKLLILIIIIPVFFSGCTIEKWAAEMWKENKLLLIGGVILFFLFIIILLSLISRSKNKEVDTNNNEEQEKAIDSELDEESPDYKTEYLDIDSEKIKNNIEIEKPEQTSSIAVSVRGDKIGTFKIPYEGTIIGRDPSKSTIVISEAIVSKSHLKITPKDDGFIIEDLNSTNGTYINGDQISKSVISIDDTILIGKKGNIAITFE